MSVVDIYKAPGRESRRCKYWWFDGWDRLVNGLISIMGKPVIRTDRNQVAIDPHIHTLYSHCSISQPERILLHAASIGLGAIAIMDHNEAIGANDAIKCANDLKRRKLLPEEFLVIPGTEVNSSHGHIGALFTNEIFPKDKTPEETVRMIHEAGGLAVAVHPYHSSGIGDALYDAPFDAIEVECGAVFASKSRSKNLSLCMDKRLSGVTRLGSSDAHYVWAIGNCYTVVEVKEPTLDAVRDAILKGHTKALVSKPYLRLQRMLGNIPQLH